MILLAVGVVMVFSASWATAYLGDQGSGSGQGNAATASRGSQGSGQGGAAPAAGGASASGGASVSQTESCPPDGCQGDSYYYLKRELLFAGLGLALMFGIARYDFTRLRKHAPALMVASLVLLMVVLVIGTSTNGARRWLGSGQYSFQPAELAKLGVVLYVAAIMFKRPRLVRDLKSMALPLLGLPMLAALLVLVEPDMGTAITLVLTVIGMLIIGGIRKRDLAALGGGAGVLGLIFAVAEPYRMARLTSFINPWKDAHDTGFQIIQSLVALGSGGIFGVGLGQSIQKFNYLPEAHTDMILAIIGEELGLLGVLGVVLLYVALAYIGFRIALKCDNLFGKYVAAGITSLLVSQAALNVGAVTGMLPLTGIPLPIISYGGSSLLVILIGIGVLLNISVNPRSKIATVPQSRVRARQGGDGGGRHRRPSGAGAGGRRRAQG